LSRLTDEKPTLAELASQLIEYLAVIYAEPPQAAVLTIPPEVATAKLAAGAPLLRGEAVDLGPAVQTRLKNLVAALPRFQPDTAPTLQKALRSGALDPGELVAAVLDGEPQLIHERAAFLGLDAPLIASLLALALFPDLVSIRAGLEPLLAAGSWSQGYCPV